MDAAATKVRVHGMEIVVASPSMHELLRLVERVAPVNMAVLITGETGCGKELIARAIHSQSPRAAGPWVDVNCAALPEHLIESELFGYEKGAFSGADTTKPGMFELAHKGTLFLDEIGELDPKGQVKLLRVLDNMPYYRLGGNRKVMVDVRIVAATNRSLEDGVKMGKLRADLYHRLSQFQIRVPPLRDRPEDVLALADYFLRQWQPDMTFSFGARELLRAYSWPGNVRELKNMVTQAAMKVTGTEIRRIDLPPEIAARGEAPPRSPEANEFSSRPEEEPDLDELEKQAILRAMARTGGHQGMAAEQLGLSRRTLSRRLKRYGIDPRPGNGGWRGAREQQCFRLALAIPVTLDCADGEQVVNSMDISSNGVRVEGVQNPFQLAAGLKVSFSLPDDPETICAHAHVVWADPFGRVGLRFVDLGEAHSERLGRWLDEQRSAQGTQEPAAASNSATLLATGLLALADSSD